MPCPHHTCRPASPGPHRSAAPAPEAAPQPPGPQRPRARRARPRRLNDPLQAALDALLPPSTAQEASAAAPHLWLPQHMRCPARARSALGNAALYWANRLREWLRRLDLGWLLRRFVLPTSEQRDPASESPLLQGGWHIDVAARRLRYIGPSAPAPSAHPTAQSTPAQTITIEGDPAHWCLRLRSLPAAQDGLHTCVLELHHRHDSAAQGSSGPGPLTIVLCQARGPRSAELGTRMGLLVRTLAAHWGVGCEILENA